MGLVVIMGAGLEVGVCGSGAEVEGSEVKISMSNAEVVADTGLFSPLRVEVSTLSGSRTVVDPFSAGKGELNVASPDLVTTVL